MEQEQLKKVIEVLIFASDSPLTIKQMKAIIEDSDIELIEAAVRELQQSFEQNNFAFKITNVAGGYQFATRPEYARWIKRLFEGRTGTRLSRAALEALAIIAFKQPISRVDVSGIRGVNSDGVVKHLLERNLIMISGRAEDRGRPLLYSTTDKFLQYFGVNSLAELPHPREIEELVSEGMATDILEKLESENNPQPQKNGQEKEEIKQTTDDTT